VRHYWLADADTRVLETLELDAGRYRETARLTGDARFRPAVFPGLDIPLSSLWT
jgi:Uma2 family endonuclease